MANSRLLRDASVQDIQLELIRRTDHNAFEGEKIYKSLRTHRRLWKAVLFDRPGVPNYGNPTVLLTLGLVKLRDLPENVWNADTLFLLTPTSADAKKLARIGVREWGGMAQVHDDREETDRALGFSRDKYGLVSIWWD